MDPMKKGAKTLGRWVITSPNLMGWLPWIGMAIIILGLAGIILGLFMIIHLAACIQGTAFVILGGAEIISGTMLFFTMCIVEDLTGLF